MTYHEQLKTSHWKKIRNNILDRDLHTCQNCNNSKIKQNCVRIEAVLWGHSAFSLEFQFTYKNMDFYKPVYCSKPGNDYNLVGNKRYNLYIDEVRSEPRICGIEIYHNYKGIREGLKTEIEDLKIQLNQANFSTRSALQRKIIELSKNLNFFETREGIISTRFLCLDVHHTCYIDGNMAWEVFSYDDLQTLCFYCHKEFHKHNSVPVKDKQQNVLRMVKPWLDDVPNIFNQEYFDVGILNEL